VLADFGIARMTGVDLSRSGPGHLVGTAAYLAPETISSGRIDHRSDLYALGVLFHEMLAGRKPFEAPGPLEMMDMHLKAPVPRLPRALGWAQPLLDGLLAKRPEDRFPGADSLIAAVLRVVTDQQAAVPG
jgi:serine/threonine protein kinase